MATSSFAHDYQTQTAGTVITDLVPGVADKVARVEALIYEAAGTAHTLTIMRVVATTALAASAASGQKVLNLKTASPGLDTSGDSEALAANDYLAWVDQHGRWQFDIVASVSVNDVTMTANLATLAPVDAPVYAFYEVGRATHTAFNGKASTINELLGIAVDGELTRQYDLYNQHDGKGMPLLFHSDNGTAAGFLRALTGIYV